MLKLAIVLIAGTALLSAVCFAEEKAPVESVKVQGLVGVTKDANGDITTVTLITKDGVVYNVMLDENGKKLGEEMADEQVEAEGTVSKIGDKEWITVQSYKAVEEESKM
jgi:hypothetical protein